MAALTNTVYVMLEILLAVRWEMVSKVSQAVLAVVSLGVIDFSDPPHFSEQQVCDATGQICRIFPSNEKKILRPNSCVPEWKGSNGGKQHHKAYSQRNGNKTAVSQTSEQSR